MTPRLAWEEQRPFRAVLEADAEVTLDAAQLNAAFDLTAHCATSIVSPMPWRPCEELPVTIELPQVHSGKVRELYDAGDGRLLMVASDRVSAFDVVMAEPITDKGRVLTAMTTFWCDEMADVVPGSLITADPVAIADTPGRAALPADWAGRAVLVRAAEMLHLECIVRGYLAGSAYLEYERSGTVNGTAMPAGLQLASQLDEPIFTPSTKAAEGHDVNIDFAGAIDLVGAEAALAARQALPRALPACRGPLRRGRVRAGRHQVRARLRRRRALLCDEVCTPDSSRLWPAEQVVPGQTPPAFDKQPLRDWLAAQPWDRRRHRPRCPARSPRPVGALRRRLRACHRALAGRLVRCDGDEVPGARRGAIAARHRRPGGRTIERALPALGFAGVAHVRAGSSFSFEVDAADEADARARRRASWPTACWPTR